MDRTSGSEREKLTEDIERIKLALQTNTGDVTSDEETGHLDSELEQDEDVQSSIIAEEGPVSDTDSRTPVDFAAPGHEDDLQSETTDMLPFGSDTEELPSTLETCLGLNRAYQEVLMENLKKIELVLAHNRERQATLQTDLEKHLSTKVTQPKKKQLSVYSKPYFKDVNGMVPPVNEDCKQKQQYDIVDGYVKPASMWTTSEIKKLRESVKADTLQKSMRPIMNRIELEMEKMSKTISEENKKEREEAIESLNEELVDIKSSPDLAVLYGDRMNCDHVDWLKISSVDFNGTKSDSNCEFAWRNALHPSINVSKWTKDEDAALEQLAQTYGCTRWEMMAEELQTSRSGFLCLQRYQTKLNPCLNTGRWTPEEAKFLIEVIEGCVENGNIQWNQVAYYMEGRSREQCIAKWETMNQSKLSKGKWTQEEDLNLVDAVQRFGQKNWNYISRFVQGRTAIQVRDRWHNNLDPSLTFGNWTYSEDRILWLWVQENGPGGWSKIAPKLPGRTENACLQRWKCLNNWAQKNEILKNMTVDKQPKAKENHAESREKAIDMVVSQTSASLKKRIERSSDLVTPIGSTLATVTLKTKPKQARHNKRDAGLEHLARKKIKESEERHDTAGEMQMKVDQDQDIHIPRPPDKALSTRLFSSVIDRRARLHQTIMDRVNRQLQANDTTIDSKLSVETSKPKGTKKVDQTKEKIDELSANPTVKQLLEITSKGTKCRRKAKYGRPKHSQEDSQIENDIAKLLRDRVTRKAKPGRPRKFLVQDTVRGSNPVENTVRSQDTITTITKLLFTALNVDKDRAVSNAEKERRKLLMYPPYDPDDTLRTAPSQQSSDVIHAGKQFRIIEGKIGAPVIESDIMLLERATGQKIVSGNKPKGVSNSENFDGANLESRGFEEVTEPAPKRVKLNDKTQSAEEPLDLSSPKSTLLQRTISSPFQGYKKKQTNDGMRRRPDASSDMHQEFLHREVNQEFPRAMLGGPAAKKAYGMPPLPPTCSTLNAFKHLLLKRRGFMHMSSKSGRKRVSRKTNSTDLGNTSIYNHDQYKLQQRANSCSSQDTPIGNSTSEDTLEIGAGGISSEAKEVTLSKEEVLPPNLKVSNKFKPGDFVGDVTAVVSNVPPKAKLRRQLNGQLLEEIRKTHDYSLFRARFFSLFLWPALLSAVPVKPEDLTHITTSQEDNTHENNNDSDGSESKDKKKKKSKRYPYSRGKKYRAYCAKPKDKKDMIIAGLTEYTKSGTEPGDSEKPKAAKRQKKQPSLDAPPVRRSSRATKPVNRDSLEPILIEANAGDLIKSSDEVKPLNSQNGIIPGASGINDVAGLRIGDGNAQNISMYSSNLTNNNIAQVAGGLNLTQPQIIPITGLGNTLEAEQSASTIQPVISFDQSSMLNIVSQVNSLFQQGALQDLIKQGQVKLLDPSTLANTNIVPISGTQLNADPAQISEETEANPVITNNSQ